MADPVTNLQDQDAAGLTVSASIPLAAVAISVLKKLGGSTILENDTSRRLDRPADRKPASGRYVPRR
jgi:hypothetical protein